MNLYIAAVAFAIAVISENGDMFRKTSDFYSLLEKTATEEELVEAIWENEVECPLPTFSMTRKAFGISKDGMYSTDEKVNLIYRARELRRGFGLCRTRANRTKDLSPASFPDTKKGKMMVEYLVSQKIGVKDLVSYLVTGKEAERAYKTSYLERSTKPLGEMTYDEQVTWLYRIQETKNRERKMHEESPRQPRIKKDQQKNENGKPPVKLWRANGK